MSNVFVLDTDKNPLNPVHPQQSKNATEPGKSGSMEALSIYDNFEGDY